MKPRTAVHPDAPPSASGLLIGARSQSDFIEVPKEVLAFYYGWYANPEVSKRWFHWKDVDVAARRIGESTHYPILGPYDSHDPIVVETHCRQASKAGLTGFIVSWWAKGDFHDEGLPLILNQAEKYGLKVTIYYETVPPRDHPTIEGAVDDLSYIIEKYGVHPAWLKVRNQSVIFVFERAIMQLKLYRWEKVIKDLKVKYPGGVMFIGDRISSNAARIFDGIHTYNPTPLTKGKSPEQLRAWARALFPAWVKIAAQIASRV